MIHTEETGRRIVEIAHTYLGQPFDIKDFDCVYFIKAVYQKVGIEIPRFWAKDYPPQDFNLTPEELLQMPLGSTLFLKRKATTVVRPWTHMVLIASPTHFIHNSRFFGHKVVLTPKDVVLEYYYHVPKLL